MRWLIYFMAFNLGLMAFVLLVLWATTDLFGGTGAGAMSVHGWIAMFLGIALTSALGVGLMSLVFYSSRGRHDERVHNRLDGEP